MEKSPRTKNKTSPCIACIGLMLILTGISDDASAQAAPPPAPARIVCYAGLLHPIMTFSSHSTDVNFKNRYVVGVPVGINVWKSSRIGFSAEFVPVITSEKGVSKMSNFLFHPGILVALGNGFTFAGRAAFETSGRFGLTPVFNKVIIKGKYTSAYLAIPVPVRFGNARPVTYTLAFQFGILI